MKKKEKYIEEMFGAGTKELLTNQRQEYIRSLEMSVQILQREVEHLRNQIKPSISNKELDNSINNNSVLNQTISFFECIRSSDVVSMLHDHLSSKYNLLESNIYYYSTEGKLIPASQTTTESTLTDRTPRLTEAGVIDWTMELKSVKIIPDLEPINDSKQTYILLAPIFLHGTSFGIYLAVSQDDETNFSDSDLEYIIFITEQAAASLDNIRSAEEIMNMNRRLTNLNSKMLESSRFASIGELAASFAIEIDPPLQLIKVNVGLWETGVGQPERRIKIIKEQIEKISEINNRLSKIAREARQQSSSDKISLCLLLDEVLLFSGSQFTRNGIHIDKEYESQDIIISGNKTQLELAFLNIMLFARDSMPDGGNILLRVYKQSERQAVVLISDNGRGFTEEELQDMFEPSTLSSNSAKSGLYLSNNIIEQHKGTVSVFSEIDKGTTYKAIFPALLK